MKLRDMALTWADSYADDCFVDGGWDSTDEAIRYLKRRFDDLGPDGGESLPKRYHATIIREFNTRIAWLEKQQLKQLKG